MRGGWSVGHDAAVRDVRVRSGGVHAIRRSRRIGSSRSSADSASRRRSSVASPRRSATTVGNDVDLLETSRVRRTDFNASLDLRPSSRLRVNATYVSTAFTRRSDGERSAFHAHPARQSGVSARAAAVRARRVAVHGDASRSAARPAHGRDSPHRKREHAAPSSPSASNALRTDWLVSYRPAPGTVFFLGYGGSSASPIRSHFRSFAGATIRFS